MKRLYILLFFSFALVSVKSQQNFPLPTDNPFWTESHSSLWSCSYSFDCGGYYCDCTTPVYYKSDTIINNTVYNRLYSRGVCHAIWAGGPPVGNCPYTFEYTNPEILYAIIRQDTINKVVYLWDYSKDTILYDFKNIHVGEAYPSTYNNLMQNNLIVVSEDSLLLNNLYVKKWNLAMNWEGVVTDSAFVCIIDGIGSSFGILANLVPPFENEDQLLCFSKNDVVIYPDSNFSCDKTVRITKHAENSTFKIYPNPATEILTVETDYVYKKSCFIKILNTAGIEIFKHEIRENKTTIKLPELSAGVYFVQLINGDIVETKKFIKE